MFPLDSKTVSPSQNAIFPLAGKTVSSSQDEPILWWTYARKKFVHDKWKNRFYLDRMKNLFL